MYNKSLRKCGCTVNSINTVIQGQGVSLSQESQHKAQYTWCAIDNKKATATKYQWGENWALFKKITNIDKIGL